MRAILELEMPSCCALCIAHDYLEHHFGTTEMCRGVTDGREIDTDINNERPNWCPLVSL